jgi:transcriptional regulatory protein LEU3
MPPGTDVRKQGLLKAYAAAVTLITNAADADEKWNFILFASSGFTQVIVVAAMALMKVVNSSFSRYIDIEDGKHAFNTAISLIRKSSVEDNDLPGRVSKIIAQLWYLHRSLNQRKEEEPTVNIKTRWGASLLHDSLWTWREEFGGQKAPPQTSNAATLSSSGNQAPISNGTIPPLYSALIWSWLLI